MATDIRTGITGRTAHPAKVIYPAKEDHRGSAIEGFIVAIVIEVIGVALVILVVKGILLGIR